MPLSDSDIFKAQIYKSRPTEQERHNFTNRWKELTQVCNNSGSSIDDMFRYYSHVLRAQAKDKSKEMGLRKFYSQEGSRRLKEDCLMDDIIDLANFWYYLNTQEEPLDEAGYKISTEARQYLHCLSRYPNEFWKYTTTAYFYAHYNDPIFEEKFTEFLKELTAYLFAKFVDYPSVNAIKDDTYSSCISVMENHRVKFKFKLDKMMIKDKLQGHSSSRISRSLLLLHAYLHKDQNELISNRFDIEHIFPKKWQDTNYDGWNQKDAQTFLDRFGNKIIFEKKLNIQAGNGYFGVKKCKYGESKISIVLDLSNYPESDWVKEDIEKREEQFKGDILSFFEEHIPLTVSDSSSQATI